MIYLTYLQTCLKTRTFIEHKKPENFINLIYFFFTYVKEEWFCFVSLEVCLILGAMLEWWNFTLNALTEHFLEFTS
jgi:hypothetical protein